MQNCIQSGLHILWFCYYGQFSLCTEHVHIFDDKMNLASCFSKKNVVLFLGGMCYFNIYSKFIGTVCIAVFPYLLPSFLIFLSFHPLTCSFFIHRAPGIPVWHYPQPTSKWLEKGAVFSVAPSSSLSLPPGSPPTQLVHHSITSSC